MQQQNSVVNGAANHPYRGIKIILRNKFAKADKEVTLIMDFVSSAMPIAIEKKG